MTKDDLAHAGRALYGDRWQSALARTLGMGARHMRKLASGDVPIHADLASEIEGLLARTLAEGDQPSIIVGRGDDGCEYAIHLGSPPFVARVIALRANGRALRSADQGALEGGPVARGNGLALCLARSLDLKPLGAGAADALSLAVPKVEAVRAGRTAAPSSGDARPPAVETR